MTIIMCCAAINIMSRNSTLNYNKGINTFHNLQEVDVYLYVGRCYVAFFLLCVVGYPFVITRVLSEIPLEICLVPLLY